jgi:hypothetical protein
LHLQVIFKMRTVTAEYVSAEDLIHEESVGRYTVQVLRYGLDKEIVYRVLLEGRKVPCMTRADERAYPKRPAQRGSALVRELKRPTCSACGAIYSRETFEGDGGLWQHLGPLMGLGHYCTGDFNEAITQADYRQRRGERCQEKESQTVSTLF